MLQCDVIFFFTNTEIRMISYFIYCWFASLMAYDDHNGNMTESWQFTTVAQDIYSSAIHCIYGNDIYAIVLGII